MTHSITEDSYTVMICNRPAELPPALPKGLRAAFYAPGDETEWCNLQVSEGRFLNRDEAVNAFGLWFGGKDEFLKKRMVFLWDEAEGCVACGCLWPGLNAGRMSERLCCLAGNQGPRHDFLMRAVVERLLAVYRGETRTSGVYALVGIRDRALRSVLKEEGFQQQFRVPFREVSQFPESVPVGAEPGGPMFFNHATMFVKCSSCKVFEITAPQQSGYMPHSHDYMQIWYVTRGSCQHDVEGEEYNMVIGDAFLLPPKVTHRTVLHDGASILCCEFCLEELFSSISGVDYNRVRELTQGISFTMLFQRELQSTQPRFTLSCGAQRSVEHLMHAMLEEYSDGAPFYEDYLHLQILELLLVFAREYMRQPAHVESEGVYDKYRQMVEHAVDYINRHYDEPLTLESVCKVSMVSKTYFCYLFKLLTQKTFVEYLMDLRVSKAMELLRQTDRSVIDISQSVGFLNSTHFSRTFKRLKGISPREYRATNQR